MSGSVPSPCIAVCVLDPESGFCKGCLRTVEEIGAWLDLDEEERRGVLARIADRRGAVGA